MRFILALLFFFFFFFNDTATTEIYTLSLHDALPIWFMTDGGDWSDHEPDIACFRSEEHTSELQSRGLISYAVFCLKKKKHYLPHNVTTAQLHTASSTIALTAA